MSEQHEHDDVARGARRDSGLDDLRSAGLPNEGDGAPGLPALLERLVDLVERARAMPMSSSVLVNRVEALGIIDEIFDALPTQLVQADEVLSDADRALDDAQVESERVLAEAHATAERLVASSSLVEQSQERAAQIISQAEAQAAALRREADDYCDRRLAEFEIDLGRIINQVQAGRAKLAGRLDEA